MPQDSLSVWQKRMKVEIKPLDKKDPAIKNFVNYVHARVNGKLNVSTPLAGPPSTFTFMKAIFETEVKKITNSDKTNDSAKKISEAWFKAVSSSTMIVPAGTYVGVPTPATIFSVAVAVVNSASLNSAKRTLQSELINVKPVDDPEKSEFAKALRKAFASLKYDVSGLNSLPIPAPLSAIGVTVI